MTGEARDRRRPVAPETTFLRRRDAEAENSFTLLAESIADLIVAFDPAGVIVYANRAAISILAAAEGAGLVGGRLADLVIDPTPADLALLLAGAASGDGVARREVTLRRPSGDVVVLDVTFGTLEIGGVPVFVASGRDLTAERLAARELETLRRRNELIVTSVLEGIVLMDRDGMVAYANPAAHALLGYAPGSLEGTFFHEVAHHTDPDGRPYLWQHCPTYTGLRDGETYVDSRERYWRRDGSPIDVAVTFAPIRDDDEVTGAVLVLSDVSKEVAHERAKDEFVAIVSHELRTPLTSLKGSLGLLVAGVYGPMPAEADEMLTLALTSTDRLIRLVNNILDLQRINAGRFPLQLAEWSVATLVQSAIGDVQPVADARHTTLESDVDDGTVFCDGDRIVQVITNLLANAVKFSPEGSTVVVRASADEREVVIRVIDNGRGIPADRLGSIFDRFVQVDESDARYGSGTGLGLAVAKAVVERHAGRLGVSSDVGRGSVFTVTLPAAGPPVPDDEGAP
jgi:PAS domain S-box-containing protein